MTGRSAYYGRSTTPRSPDSDGEHNSPSRRCRCERYLMTDVKHYLVGEHIEDFNSGLISRRELLRRVTLITGSIASSLVLLDVAGCQSQPGGAPPSPASRQTSTPQPFATPPAQP